MKNLRPLLPVLSAAAALLFFVCSYLALRFFMPEAPSAGAGEAAADLTIIAGGADGLRSLHITLEDEELVFTVLPDHGGMLSVSLEPERAGWLYEDVKLSGVCRAVCPLEAVDRLGDELPEYGFSSPSAQVTALFSSGTQEILIGSRSPLPEGYYVKRLSDGSVFIAPASACEKLLQSERDYRRLSFLPYYQDATAEVTRLTLSVPGRERLDIVRLKDGTYELESPFKAKLDRYALGINLLTPATRIAVLRIIEDTDGIPRGYGLEEPSKLYIQDINGNEVTFLIGDADGNMRRLMVEGVPSLLEAPAPDFAFLSVEPEELIPGAQVEAPDADGEGFFD